jgi:hypothetical protein
MRPLLLALALCATACPNWNRPVCPTPGTYDCRNDQPFFCGTAREWTPVGDEPCAVQGRVCGFTVDHTATCLRSPR